MCHLSILSNPNRLGAAAGGVVQRGVDGCLGWRGAMDTVRGMSSQKVHEDLFQNAQKIYQEDSKVPCL